MKSLKIEDAQNLNSSQSKSTKSSIHKRRMSLKKADKIYKKMMDYEEYKV